MADKTRVEGLKRFRAKVLGRLPKAARDQMRQANEKNADEFMGLVRRIIPKGDPEDGRLVDTLRKEDDRLSEVGVRVTIGGQETGQKHPMHLEGGHRAADGTHVPGKPFWNPSKTVTTKRAYARNRRSRNKVVKEMAQK